MWSVIGFIVGWSIATIITEIRRSKELKRMFFHGFPPPTRPAPPMPIVKPAKAERESK